MPDGDPDNGGDNGPAGRGPLRVGELPDNRNN